MLIDFFKNIVHYGDNAFITQINLPRNLRMHIFRCILFTICLIIALPCASAPVDQGAPTAASPIQPSPKGVDGQGPVKPQTPDKKTPSYEQQVTPNGHKFSLPSRLPGTFAIPVEQEKKDDTAEKQEKLKADALEKYGQVNFKLVENSGAYEKAQKQLLLQAIPQKAIFIANQLKQAAIKKTLPGYLDNKAFFYGRQGTGKSVFIEKMARDAGWEYMPVFGPTLVNEYQGSGAQNIDRTFEAALARAETTGKRVLVNIEEIDAIAKVNSNDRNAKTEETATQALWLKLDRYTGDPRLFIIFTTNHFDKLNPVFRDRFRDAYLVEFPNPHEKLREDLIKMYLKEDGIDLESTLKISSLDTKRFIYDMAVRSNGMSIRAIENMIHSVKLHVLNEPANQKITRTAVMQILAESKRKSAEVKDSKKEWEKADEWTQRVGSMLGAGHNSIIILSAARSVLEHFGFIEKAK